MRLRGGYAILAGLLLLVGVPLFQSLVLAPTGYLTAVHAVEARQQFGLLLIWAAAHPAETRTFRVFEVIPFLLALGLPRPLRTLLWRDRLKDGRVALWSGRFGFALFVLALFIGMFTSASAASHYVASGLASDRQAIALDYAGHYAVETLLSRVVGGITLTVFVVAVSLRVVRSGLLPRWFGWFGILAAALQATTALLFALGPAQAATPTSGLAFVLLALWLFATGLLLLRMRAPSDAHTETPTS
jgi:hypothetical protein